MKKILSFLALSVMFITAAFALVACGDAETYVYSLNSDGNSYCLASYGGTETYVTVPETYAGKSVTAIGGNAFSGKSLSGVVIPSSVKSIGNNAFENCGSLKAVKMDGVSEIGNYAFSGCNSLTSVTLGSEIKEIKIGTFYKCGGLREISFSTGIKNIGDYAFYCCTALETVDLPDTVDTLGNYVFAGCTSLQKATIGNGIKKIDIKTFYNCKSMTSVSIGSSVLTIESRAFDNCEKLEEIVLPNGLETIGDYAFVNCGALANVIIPDSITRVGHNAFEGCGSLSFNSYYEEPTQEEIDAKIDPNEKRTGLYLGNDVNKCLVLVKTTSMTVTDCEISPTTRVIADYALYNCTLLKTITVPDSVNCIGNSAFSGCSSLTSVTLGNGVALVGNRLTHNSPIRYNFYGDGVYLGSATNPYKVLLKVKTTEVDTFSVNDNTEVIATEAFADCHNLTAIESMKSVKYICDRAFVYCRALSEIAITDNLVYVGEDAFLRCNSLQQEKDGLIYIKKLGSATENKILIGVAEGKENVLNECVLDKDVTIIAKNALPNNSYIKKITLNESLKNISNNIFAYCNELKAIEVDDENDYYSSKGGVLYDKGQNFVYIVPRRLGGNVTLSDNVLYIQQNAFAHCIDLVGITVDEENDYFSTKDGILFNKARTAIVFVPTKVNGEVVLPDTLIKIDDAAFCGRVDMEKITISNSVISIGAYAFLGCDCEIVWSEIGTPTLTKIGDYAFNGYKGASIEIPVSVTEIGEQAFGYCENLVSVLMPETLESIGEGAFYECVALTELIMPSGLKSIGSYAFYGCSCGFDWGETPSITTIGEKAFNGYKGASVEIPDTVKEIGTQAFGGCDKLTAITLNGVEILENGAFYGCSALTEVTIGNTVKSIGGYAFNECGALKSITFNGTKDEWNAVEKNSKWNFSQNITQIVCSDGTIAL